MCEKCECEEEEISKEEIINVFAEEIKAGECLYCNLESLFDLAYKIGQKDLAEDSRDFYQYVLDDDIDE